MTQISSVVSYTDVSVVDGQGFAVVTAGEVSFASRVAFFSPANPDGQDDAGKDGGGLSCVLLHPSGGRMLPPETVVSQFPGKSVVEVAEQIEVAIAHQNADVVRAALGHSLRKSTGASMYPAHVREAFRGMVIAHAKGLRQSYLQQFMYGYGKVSEGEATINRWAREWLSETGMSLKDWFANREEGYEEIGRIEGNPVYFSRRFAMYGYAGHPEAKIILELWLTGPNYPPGW